MFLLYSLFIVCLSHCYFLSLLLCVFLYLLLYSLLYLLPDYLLCLHLFAFTFSIWLLTLLSAFSHRSMSHFRVSSAPSLPLPCLNSLQLISIRTEDDVIAPFTQNKHKHRRTHGAALSKRPLRLAAAWRQCAALREGCRLQNKG